MKTLIIGRGVVGTIYGWALSQAGIDVTHVVRKEGLPSTDTWDVLDLRPGYPKHTRVKYAAKTVGQISPLDGFDLVITSMCSTPVRTWAWLCRTCPRFAKRSNVIR